MRDTDLDTHIRKEAAIAARHMEYANYVKACRANGVPNGYIKRRREWRARKRNVSYDYVLWQAKAPSIAKPIRPGAKSVARRVGQLRAFLSARMQRGPVSPPPYVRAKRDGTRYNCHGKVIAREPGVVERIADALGLAPKAV